MDNPQLHRLNPEAGSHPITSDPREIEAASRAAERTHREITYYRERYGERGDRFAASDSAWILGILDFEWPRVLDQVLWLRTLLSSRGMPSSLLERHLRILHDEVRGAGIEEDRHDFLRQAADHLRDQRVTVIPDAEMERLANEFDSRAPTDWVERLPWMGHILVAAVVDEALGIDDAVNSVTVWTLDRERFPEAWRAAVEETVRAARAIVTPEQAAV